MIDFYSSMGQIQKGLTTRAAIQVGFLSSEQQLLLLQVPAGLHPARAESCPVHQADALPPALHLGPELNRHAEILCKTCAGTFFSVGFRQYEEFPKSQSITISVRGHESGNVHGNYFTS